MMFARSSLRILLLALVLTSAVVHGQTVTPTDSVAGWIKYEHNPIITDKDGILFDICVIHDAGAYRLWAGWRPKNSIALLESKDGLHFSGPPKIVLGPAPTGWEDIVNRPMVIKREDGYHMWYEAQTATASVVGYATSPDGVTWKRMSSKPVLAPTLPWEKAAIQCPDVMWDADAKLYKMWYSAGPQSESDAMGYATSPDGMTWTKSDKNPIFNGDPKIPWEQERGVAGHVEKQGGWYYMFYIGFHDIAHAQLGVARSRDGITNWQRLPQNPIVRMGTGKWDDSSCYRPFTIFDGTKWYLWYGGRKDGSEQVGVAIHDGADLGFPESK
jgi:predicted GH43/DUF377 family glycosyl hydrolase